ncbi:MAG TPA: lamin tail domain-containing protein [Chitinispirillaceae bacterium]|nr:lamin tail domain-containing protein [Chitinispirillaceae bacterium]
MNCKRLLKAGALIATMAVLSFSDVFITEINYNPLSLDTINGDNFEFIELFNPGTTPVSMGGMAITNGVTYSFPANTSLGAGQYIVLAYNKDMFKQRYGVEPFGVFTGHLDNKGEKITLKDTVNNLTVFSVDYKTDIPWPISADGAGFTLVKANSNSNDPDSAAWWRASSKIGGSPGAVDPDPKNISPIYINEVLSNTDDPHLYDAIELFNPNDGAVDISGWYLTDDKKVPRKFKIPSGTNIPSKGYTYFTEQDFDKDSTNPNSFSLNTHGDGAYIFSADNNDSLSGFSHGFDYGEIENGISFGRVVDNSGREHFVPMKELTLGNKNSDPIVGPLVITEICYNANNGTDYIAIKNITDKTISPFDPDRPFNAWRINGIGFYFPKNVTVGAGETVLISSDTITEALFRQIYSVPASVKMFTYPSNLSGKGEKVSIEKPCDPYWDKNIDSVDSIIPYMLVDEIKFDNSSPWPVCNLGMAISRKNPLVFGNDPSAWVAKVASPGTISSIFSRKAGISTLNHVNWSFKNNSFQLVLSRNSNVKLSLYDIGGRSVFSYASFLRSGANSIPCNIESRAAGTYVLKIQTDSDQMQIKFPNYK